LARKQKDRFFFFREKMHRGELSKNSENELKRLIGIIIVLGEQI